MDNVKKVQLNTTQIMLNAVIEKLNEIDKFIKYYEDVKRGIVNYDGELDIEELEIIDKLAQIQGILTSK